MATITTTLDPVVYMTPFTGPTTLSRIGTSIARSELRYYVNSGDWPAPGASNNKKLKIEIDLPKDYAYLCTDVSLQVRGDPTVYANNQGDIAFNSDPGTAGTAPDYRTLVADFWTGSSPGAQSTAITTSAAQVRYEAAIVSKDSVNLESRKNYVPKSLPSYLLFPFTDTRYQSEVNVALEDGTSNSVAYTIFYFARFIQYDISQVYNWAPNSPVR